MSGVMEQAREAKRASYGMQLLDTATKIKALHAMADALVSHTDKLLLENGRDVAAARAAGRSEAFLSTGWRCPKRASRAWRRG